MPDDSRTLTAPPERPSFAMPALPRPALGKRETFIGFVRDEASAALLHECLAGRIPNDNRVHVVDFRASLEILAAMTTPEVVLVDLSGEAQPVNAIMDLAEMVEEGTVVLAVGEHQSINFYRTVTKGMGVREYLQKPLTSEAVARNFLPCFAAGGAPPAAAQARGGRMAAVAGTRGGVGTTTIAVNLAWYIATELRRHTTLLDGALNNGTVGLHLNLPPSRGLTAVLEAPERVDGLLLERSMQDAADRLHVLAGMEELERNAAFSAESAVKFIQLIRGRYNFAVADAGARLEPFARDLLFNAQQRIIVMDPSMISVRNLERLATLPGGSAQAPRPLLVLNRAGAPGGLAQSYMEQTMGLRFDAVIPDLPRIVPRSTQLGTPAAALRGPFRDGIAALAKAVGEVHFSG
ncbi:pilus assembly protein CpaE [Acidocella sp. KAb 2-4]|uniref:AAA family ATPase n=1 Tax=Acidocella sp. KAb 2-4 TaxID=2885158 RepID=UPI001D07C68A|nr:pilus assembly protein CpaE [Acidocella sp. KAb 2-4]MCB5943477.1 pilus assembly protein CpaE [Acidocella sp. KAb 2-4]